MKNTNKPKIILSKCLKFENCRYNGQPVKDNFVNKLGSFVEFIPICPEIEIGLSTPRNPIRMAFFDNKLRLIQPSTNLDFTENMENFSNTFLNSINEVDGFLLKSKSPSCGINNVKVYNGTQNSVRYKSNGVFAKNILNRFSHLAVEDEGRLRNFNIKDHFLTKVFILSIFRDIKSSNSIENLIKFHNKNKLLIMAYNQHELSNLENIIKDSEIKLKNEILSRYEIHLYEALKQFRSLESNIYTINHCLDYFSMYLSNEERIFFNEIVEKYKNKKVNFSVPINILNSYCVRFENEYLLNQTFFNPYPEELFDIEDSKK